MCFKNHNSEFYIQLFKTYVRPLLECNTVVFSPNTIQDINMLERVQRRFTKFLPNLFNISYLDRLCILNLETLEERRIISDLCLVYKICFGLINLNVEEYFTFTERASRGHPLQIYKCYTRTNSNKFYWANRVVDIWNGLPAAVVSVNSFTNFKSQLKELDLKEHCKGTAFTEAY